MEPILIANSVLLWVLVLLNLILTLALIRRVSSSSASNSVRHTHVDLRKGEPAPDFAAQTLQGEKVTLATYMNKRQPLALVVIKPSCGPCRASMPRYESLFPQALSAGTQLVLVSVGDRASTQEFVEEFKVTMPVIIAPQEENPFFTNYKLQGTPSYCLIDADGNIESADYPSFNGGTWKALVDNWEASNLRGIRLTTSERG